MTVSTAESARSADKSEYLTRMITVLLIIAWLSWIPVLGTLLARNIVNVSEQTLLYTEWMGVFALSAHPFVNPIAYGGTSAKYRKEVVKLIGHLRPTRSLEKTKSSASKPSVLTAQTG